MSGVDGRKRPRHAPHTLGPPNRIWRVPGTRLALLLVLLTLTACDARNPTPSTQTIPVVPVERLMQYDGLIPDRLPLRVHDRQHPVYGYTASGEPDPQIYDADIFPTDVWIVYAHPAARVFLARSPHGGCLLQWDAERERFSDPCYGSHFARNGDYLEGPSPRALDELPAWVDGEMLWVGSEIFYGVENGKWNE